MNWLPPPPPALWWGHNICRQHPGAPPSQQAPALVLQRGLWSSLCQESAPPPRCGFAQRQTQPKSLEQQRGGRWEGARGGF